LSRGRRQRGDPLPAGWAAAVVVRCRDRDARSRPRGKHRHADLGSRHPLALSPLPRGHGVVSGGALSPAEARALRFEIEEFNAEYAAALDALEIDRWPEFFTDDAFYRITARENFDAGLPVGLVWCDGKPMMRDRAAAV